MAKKQFNVKINYNWCKSCGICYNTCPTKTIIKGEMNRPKVEDHTTCIGCLMCENLCPDFAIDIVEITEEVGEKNG
ncbi:MULTISPECIES: 4Fe-4S dicluster domain-containing protein [unclassified Thermosipho (in: thermotogales)]|uniref:4Fe-4S dicluster domain-containing protein n=1 Tax=unclassified Thermosipho (in: thermotogales) TaxID=2676525 RepID=UPI0009858812|nr:MULTISPECIES: 4Fe-4S dicluster domain-containing protein [unclassified Thermosipho (in: thermotogales)]MBT1248449.1 ferredoxin [Thermosipho sp. 1244]OOC47576.1 ferredoxin [Thermosipho sp. 1223]